MRAALTRQPVNYGHCAAGDDNVWRYDAKGRAITFTLAWGASKDYGGAGGAGGLAPNGTPCKRVGKVARREGGVLL